MAGNPPEAVGGFFEVLGLGLGAAAYRGFGRGFRAGTAPESICCTARKNRAPCLSLGAGDFGAAKGLGPCCKNRARLQQSDANQSTSQSSMSSSRGNAMTPREFQKSHLAVELKAGRKRLEDALHGLSDEQGKRAGAARSGSGVDCLSEVWTEVVLAVMGISDP